MKNRFDDEIMIELRKAKMEASAERQQNSESVRRTRSAELLAQWARLGGRISPDTPDTSRRAASAS